MNAINKCKYYEWDESNFVLPDKFKLENNSDLADALNIFWSVGGLDFFNVVDPRYYASNWLEFVGALYCKIECGEFVVTDKVYYVPINAEQKNELASRGVPAIFITDLQ
ncbi:MAG: hypothetical protein IJZ76_01915 [Lachnospiraceae bacterium]|nr:hypothetical protein [Lachnospiraceae bacterium]